MRKVDHAGHDHMVVVRVILILLQKRSNLTGADFSVMVRQGQHFMPAKLDCAGLVYADVPGACGDHAMIAFQHGVDHRGVCLRAADQKEDLCDQRLAGFADLRFRCFAIAVRAISWRFFQDLFPQDAGGSADARPPYSRRKTIRNAPYSGAPFAIDL